MPRAVRRREEILPGAGPLAAVISGYFAQRAGLPKIPTAPRVRQVQRKQLGTALPWAARALGLPPLDGPARGGMQRRVFTRTRQERMIPVTTLPDLWLPILLSGALVWIVSAVVWMALPHHKSDYRGLPDEEAARGALQPQNLAPGLYNIPNIASREAMKEPENQRKFAEGPVAFMTVLPNGDTAMAGRMVASFVYFLIAGAAVAYVTGRALGPGAECMEVFRLAGAVAWLLYGWGARPGVGVVRPAVVPAGQAALRRPAVRPGDRRDLRLAVARVVIHTGYPHWKNSRRPSTWDWSLPCISWRPYCGRFSSGNPARRLPRSQQEQAACWA